MNSDDHIEPGNPQGKNTRDQQAGRSNAAADSGEKSGASESSAGPGCEQNASPKPLGFPFSQTEPGALSAEAGRNPGAHQRAPTPTPSRTLEAIVEFLRARTRANERRAREQDKGVSKGDTNPPSHEPSLSSEEPDAVVGDDFGYDPQGSNDAKSERAQSGGHDVSKPADESHSSGAERNGALRDELSDEEILRELQQMDEELERLAARASQRASERAQVHAPGGLRPLNGDAAPGENLASSAKPPCIWSLTGELKGLMNAYNGSLSVLMHRLITHGRQSLSDSYWCVDDEVSKVHSIEDIEALSPRGHLLSDGLLSGSAVCSARDESLIFWRLWLSGGIGKPHDQAHGRSDAHWLTSPIGVRFSERLPALAGLIQKHQGLWAGTDPYELRRIIDESPQVLDWFFPADRHAFASGLNVDVTQVSALVAPWLFWRSGECFAMVKEDEMRRMARSDAPFERVEVDRIIKVAYLAVLSLLGASVDHHGWLSSLPSEAKSGSLSTGSLARGESYQASFWRLQELSPAQHQAILRVMRSVKLLGWRGYSMSMYRDMMDFRLASHMHGWLDSRLERLASADCVDYAGAKHEGRCNEIRASLHGCFSKQAQDAVTSGCEQLDVRSWPAVSIHGRSSNAWLWSPYAKESPRVFSFGPTVKRRLTLSDCGAAQRFLANLGRVLQR